MRSALTPILLATASSVRLAYSLAQTSNFGFASASTCAIVGQSVAVAYGIVKGFRCQDSRSAKFFMADTRFANGIGIEICRWKIC